MRLVERDRELDVLSRAFAAAAAGTGSGLAVSGEPGVGKSALVAAACAQAHGVRVLRGGCDPLLTPRPLGPFRDLVAELGRWDTDASLAAVCEATYAALHTEPTVLVVEDLHWVDAASVDVLRFLVRRLGTTPCALVLTYRDDEVGPQHHARPLLGDVAALDHLATLPLRALTVEGVATVLGTDAAAAARVHSVTGGNPFFVSEVAKEPDQPLPATVRDAVLARVAGISAEDLEVLQLAATAPGRLDDRLLPALGVDLPTLRRLHATGLLLRDRRGLVFRHELARLAMESTVPGGGAARLHARLLDALERVEPHDAAVLTHHAVHAGDSARALTHACAAAEEAARAGSHSEAVAFLSTALAHLGDRPALRAQLQLQLGFEQYMTSHLDVAIASVEAALPLWHRVGNRTGLAAAHDTAAVLEYYNAHRPRAEEHAERAIALAEADSARGYASARATRGYLAIQRSDFALSEACTGDTLRVAADLGDDVLTLRGSMFAAVRELALGRPDARERCLALIASARAVSLDELASTGYSHVSYLDVEQVRLRQAEQVLEESLPFTVEREIPICRHWQTAVRSRLRFREGRWTAALEDAAEVLDGVGMPVARFWPLLVRAQVASRRGADGADLEPVWALAVSLDEPLRIVPVLAALAERSWLTGTSDLRVTDALASLEARAASPALRWCVGELALWLSRLGLPTTVDPTVLGEPYGLSLTGHHDEAAAWWHAAGSPYEEALARTDSGDIDRVREGIEQLDLLGASATADRVRRDLRSRGVVSVPVRPRSSTRANPAGLTNRQLDVARLVARGFTNAEIAGRLFISPKTTDHHVSAVLTKLGMPSRRSVVVQAAELGLS